MNRLSIPFITLLVVAALVWTGCKEGTLINAKISPAKNSVGVYSTSLSCITHTYLDDTAITSTNIGSIPIYQGVGSVIDPFFGSMTTATYFQIVPRDYTTAVYSGATIDSAILVLPYSGFTYGDTLDQTTTQTYQVFYIQDTLGYSTNYYSFSSKAIDLGNPLSDPIAVNTYHLRDSFFITPLPANQAGLRLKLKLPTFINKYLMPALNTLTSTSPTGQDFINAFNGICVRTADSRQSSTALPYFRLDGIDNYSEAGVLVYYHMPGDSEQFEPYFFNSGICAHFNSVTRSYTHYPVSNLFHSTQANDDIIALSNQPGASIDVVIPGIKSLPAGVINKAELRLTLLPGSYNPVAFTTPEKLYPLGIGNGTYPVGVTAGESYFIADGVLDGYIHGFPTTNPTVQTFTIGIPRELMASIAAKNDTLHLHINGTKDFYGAFHMVAGGGSYGANGTADTIYRAKLNVVYSVLN